MTEEARNEIRQLTRIQRRVLGVLMEKAFTTPDQYPLTLKAATSGCNQKNNRDPISDYSEALIADALEELRQMGVVAEVFTDGGRAPRYRHYMRHRFDFTETQFAVIAELLLRGRQQPGELRTRASRMVKIESQDQLKSDLLELQDKGFIQSSGALERRGVEVDHTFYTPREGQKMEQLAEDSSANAGRAAASPPPTSTQSSAAPSGSVAPQGGPSPGRDVAMQQLTDVTARIAALEAALDSLQQRFERLENELGGS